MPRTNRTWRLLALVIAAALFLAACGSSSKKSSSGDSGTKDYSIAYVGPLTGDSANLGINIRNGAKTAVQEFNEGQPHLQDHAQGVRHAGRSGAGADRRRQVHQRRQASSGSSALRSPARRRRCCPTLEENELVMVSASATNTELPNVVQEQQGVPPGPPR